jgi:hypothetical protein
MTPLRFHVSIFEAPADVIGRRVLLHLFAILHSRKRLSNAFTISTLKEAAPKSQQSASTLTGGITMVAAFDKITLRMRSLYGSSMRIVSRGINDESTRDVCYFKAKPKHSLVSICCDHPPSQTRRL